MARELLREVEKVTTDASTYTFYSRYVDPGEQWLVRRICGTSNSSSAGDVEVGITSGGQVVKIAHLEDVADDDYDCVNVVERLREGERLQFVYHGTSDDVVAMHVSGEVER